MRGDKVRFLIIIVILSLALGGCAANVNPTQNPASTTPGNNITGTPEITPTPKEINKNLVSYLCDTLRSKLLNVNKNNAITPLVPVQFETSITTGPRPYVDPFVLPIEILSEASNLVNNSDSDISQVISRVLSAQTELQNYKEFVQEKHLEAIAYVEGYNDLVRATNVNPLPNNFISDELKVQVLRNTNEYWGELTEGADQFLKDIGIILEKLYYVAPNLSQN